MVGTYRKNVYFVIFDNVCFSIKIFFNNRINFKNILGIYAMDTFLEKEKMCDKLTF